MHEIKTPVTCYRHVTSLCVALSEYYSRKIRNADFAPLSLRAPFTRIIEKINYDCNPFYSFRVKFKFERPKKTPYFSIFFHTFSHIDNESKIEESILYMNISENYISCIRVSFYFVFFQEISF